MVHSRSSRSGSGASARLVFGLARKFCTITSWMWPYCSCRSRIASSDSSRSARVSPMPIRMPVVNGTASSPAMPHHLQPHRRQLVGRAVMHAAWLAQPLAAGFQHDAHAGGDFAQRGNLLARHDAGIDVRQQAGFLQHQRAHLAQVLDRRLVAQLRQSLARRAVTQFRLVAEGEQRLGAAGRRRRPGRWPAPRRPTGTPAWPARGRSANVQ